MSDARQDLEERLAHLERAQDELSDVVARQDREIAWLRARVTHLLDRDATREAGGDTPIDRPPHW